MHSVSNELAGFKPAQRWRQSSAPDVFTTAASWEWFKRHHARELIQSGQLIPGRGRRGDLVGPEIDGVIVAILRREAARQMGGVA